MAVIAVAVMGVTAFGIFLIQRGLEQADRLSSVLGLFVNLAGVAIAAAGFRQVWPRHGYDVDDLIQQLDVERLKAGDPEKVGSFTLIGRLGEGTSGIVFLGVTPGGEYGAVKVLRPGLTGDQQFRSRVEREVRDVERITHTPGQNFFAPLLDSDTAADRPWLATAYLPALSLDDAIRIGGPWSAPALGWFAHGLAKALRVLTDMDIVHRDLKPANVLLDDSGPRLIDLGIAKTGSDASLTRVGDVLGTMPFMAPEQLDGTVTSATDVFALGALLVFAANGKQPRTSTAISEMLVKIKNADVELGVLADGTHPLASLVRRCLNPDPELRPSIDDILTECAPYAAASGRDLLPAKLSEQARAREQAFAAAPGADDAVLPARRGPLTLRRAIAAAAVVAIIGALVPVVLSFAAGGDEPGEEPAVPPLASCSGPQQETLIVATSQDKYKVLVDVAKDYGVKSADGRCVGVQVVNVNSGDAMRALNRGWTDGDGVKPDVWSPSSSTWLTQARYGASDKAGAVLPEKARGSIVQTVLVIAMPEPVARLHPEVSWKSLEELAATPAFKLGKTNPYYSISGLSATYATFYALANSDGKLTPQGLASKDVQDRAERIERAIAHYGKTTLDFLKNLRAADDLDKVESYMSALTVDESSMIAYNMGYEKGTPDEDEPGEGKSEKHLVEPQTKLIARYPTEGTVVIDHPWIDLAWSDTSEAKRRAATDFYGYLHTDAVQTRFQEVGFRNFRGEPGPFADPDHGITTSAAPRQLPEPAPETVRAVLDTWSKVRKPARVRLLVDVSPSMVTEDFNGNAPETAKCESWLKALSPETEKCPTKLQLVKKLRTDIVTPFGEREEVGLYAFDSQMHEVLPMQKMTEDAKSTLAEAILHLENEGSGTALHQSLSDAVVAADKNAGGSSDYINVVVVLSDGIDTANGKDLKGLVEDLKAHPDVRVFAIDYSSSMAQRDDLAQIAGESHGLYYQANDSDKIVSDLVSAIVSGF
ncbi:protein kinase [Actinosynnema sp. NPDC023658]|uniref:protein kinase domain-containing protein n=1 Tax=Actinosynnema sp. NPDC023658 TaxID=3155465 RepID=UPI0033BFCC98